MPEFVYALCAVASVLSAALLLRSYRHNRSRLLMWSTLCFAGLAINNILLFVDQVVVPGPEIDLRIVRSISGIVALALLVFGLIWEEP
jgi:hypothetical protein